MTEPKKQPITGELDDKDLEGVAGGTAVPVTGNSPLAPKFEVPESIAQGDTIDIDNPPTRNRP
jgi:hypothetical protein